VSDHGSDKAKPPATVEGISAPEKLFETFFDERSRVHYFNDGHYWYTWLDSFICVKIAFNLSYF